MSGPFFLLGPLQYDAHEENYLQALAALGLGGASADERIRALLEAPGQDLLAKLPPARSVPAADNDMILSAVTYAQVADKACEIAKSKSSCRDLLVGDT